MIDVMEVASLFLAFGANDVLVALGLAVNASHIALFDGVIAVVAFDVERLR
jgi:uncharacterized membrane protein